MDILEIIKLYTEEYYSIAALSRKYGISGEKIKKLLVQNGVKTRTQAEQNIITNKSRALKVNHSYFDNIDTVQKAWILGFIAADGSISSDRNAIEFGLSETDSEILEKIKAELSLETEVKHQVTSKGFYIARLCWTSAPQKIKLIQYGIKPKKTYSPMSIPSILSTDEMKLAFLLGYYDGDGCFKDDGSYCRIEICSYRSELLEEFSHLIKEIFGFSKSVYKDKARDNYYTLTYSTQEAEKILNKCYEIMSQSFVLSRKKEKFNNWKEKNNRI